MQLVQEQSSLVLLGIWNPAILNPVWLAQNVHETAAGQGVQVQAEQFLLVPGQPPRFTVFGIRYTPSRNRLVIHPTEVTEENFGLAQRVAGRILSLLPHTPIAAVGQNFEFVEEHPAPEQLTIFDAANDLAERCDFDFESVSKQLTTSMRTEDRLVNLTRLNTGGQLRLKFNFHYDVPSATVAAERMANEALFWQNLDFARRIIRSVYGVEVNMADAPAPEAAALPEQAHP